MLTDFNIDDAKIVLGLGSEANQLRYMYRMMRKQGLSVRDSRLMVMGAGFWNGYHLGPYDFTPVGQ